MKQEPNNEMDLLLRRLGRRPDEPASNGDVRVDHLDADELSAYAENALPAVARARYTEHLAECSRCRDLVVSLSASAGVVVAPETTKIVAPSGFRKFLASLFSPMVLRYAAPALGLILIAVVGLIVLRRPQEGNADFIVQVPRNEAPAAPTASESPAQSSPQTFSVNREATANKQEGQSKTGEQPAPVPNAAPVVSSVEARVRPEATADTGAAPPPKESPAVAKTVETADETKSKNESVARKDAEINASRGATTANEPPPPADKAAAAPAASERRVEELPLQKRSVSGLADLQAARPAAKGRSSERERDQEDNYVESRTVSGRTFRKENGVWIDTAYSAVRSTMVLSRGSEQFRSLVADEPGIKTIADQLDGEFVVVWKGRAYRIR